MTRHFDLLPEKERVEALALHVRKDTLSPKELRRYVWLSRRALYLYALKSSV